MEKFKERFEKVIKSYDNLSFDHNYILPPYYNKSKEPVIILSTKEEMIRKVINESLNYLLGRTIKVDINSYELIIEGIIGYKIIDIGSNYIKVSTL